ncbi:unnamed protein product [Lactuca saligna]|uniref:Uncharacterized protein n=1 Tax=Lactuca saligna TaxID=75948 RepID=A0AA36E9P3_LACSI|nr:unnamed protein product [Lactuca saligna]
MQQSYNTFTISEENLSYNLCNQFSQRVSETQFQSSQPKHFQFRDSQNVESKSSSDDRFSKETKKKLTRSCNLLSRKNAPLQTARSQRNGWNAKSLL